MIEPSAELNGRPLTATKLLMYRPNAGPRRVFAQRTTSVTRLRHLTRLKGAKSHRRLLAVTVRDPTGAHLIGCIFLATLNLRRTPTLARTPVPREQIGISRIPSTRASLHSAAKRQSKPGKLSDQSIKRTDHTTPPQRPVFLLWHQKLQGGICLRQRHFVAADKKPTKGKKQKAKRRPSHAGEGTISLHSNEVAQSGPGIH